MKHLYSLQTLLLLFFFSVSPSWIIGQFADPVQVRVKNTGLFIDQFAAPDGYTAYVVQFPSPQIGDVELTAPGGNTLKLVFIPEAGANGTTDVVISYYTISAPMHPVTKTYRFHVTDEIVIADDDHFVIDSGAIDVELDVLANDSTSSGDIFIKSVSVSNAGTATVSSTGDDVIFTPDPDFTGDSWLQYIACDSTGHCEQGSIHILVRNPDLQDHLTYKKYLLNTEHLDLLMPFAGFIVDISPAHGTLASDGTTGWIYTPETDFSGSDTFQLGLLNLVSRKYIINVYDKPVNIHAQNDKFYVRPGLSVTFNVLNNDLIEYEVIDYTNPAKGVLSEAGNGVYTYTPVTGFRGVDKFTYTTCFDDSVYCETATVFIHVTDLEPDNLFTYELQTSKDIPLPIDYPIEYTDFSYIISVDPSHGELISYNGLQQINLPCDTIESYNMLVYEPEAGFTGVDHFEYYYCIQPSNLCYLVKVDMNVIDHPEAENCPCAVGCLWPGDADQDGRVDMVDLLTIGNSLGDAGPNRIYNDPAAWFGQHADQWISESNIQDVKFADTDGDGTITSADVEQVANYYYQAHDVVVRDVNQKLPYQFSLIPVQFSLDSGDLVVLDIALGNSSNPVIDLKGAKFSINVPPTMMDSSTVTLDFHEDSWLAEGAPYISLGKVPWTGRIDGGFARAKGNGATGFGVIATTTFIIVEDVEGFKINNGLIQVPVKIHSGIVMDSDGTKYDVEGDEIFLTYQINPNAQPQYKLLFYPNPAQDLVNIHLNGKTAINTVTVIDAQGRTLMQHDGINLKQHQLDVSAVPAGLYYVKVNHEKGSITQLLSIVR